MPAQRGNLLELSKAATSPARVRELRTPSADDPPHETWNPDTTYEALVRLLAELQALHPHEVALVPNGPRRHLPRGALKVVAGLVAAAVVVAGVGTLVTRRHHAAPVAAVAATPQTSTVLVTLEKNGELEGATLLSHRKGATEEILVPSRLLVDVPGQGSAPLSAAPESGANAAADAVENALHVTVGGSWVLDSTSLATLVDAVGGVDVTLTDDVLPQDGSSSVGLGAGDSHISGAQAVTLAFGIGSQEPEASRLARQQILLEALLTKLPSNATKLAGLLQGATLSGHLTDASLATTLVAVRADVISDHAASTLLPTNEIDTGSGTPAYGLDENGTEQMVSQRLSAAELPVPPGGRSRILVQNGLGTPGLGDAAREVLVAKGYAFRGGGNVTKFEGGPSVVLIPDSSGASRALGSTIASLLGLPASSVELDTEQTTIADVVVILGSDFTLKAPLGS